MNPRLRPGADPTPGRNPRHVPDGGGPARIRTALWVLDDARTEQPALAIAERTGLAFRRVPIADGRVAGLPPPLAWPWVLRARRAGLAALADRLTPAEIPQLLLSSGRAGAGAARWLKRRLGCRAVHCVALGEAVPSGFDLIVAARSAMGTALELGPGPTRALTLGTPHRISPEALSLAAEHWGERLDYLPHPRIALVVGGVARGSRLLRGSELAPARAHALGLAVARAAAASGGAVLATVGRSTGTEAADALAAGLGRSLHLIHRAGEPGEDPALGFLALADSVVTTVQSPTRLVELCAGSAGVYAALPDMANRPSRALLASLEAAGTLRPFRGSVAPWSRPPLDEAGRIAAELQVRFDLA